MSFASVTQPQATASGVSVRVVCRWVLELLRTPGSTRRRRNSVALVRVSLCDLSLQLRLETKSIKIDHGFIFE